MLRTAAVRTQQLSDSSEDGEDGEDAADREGWARLLAAGGEGTEYRVAATGAVATLLGAKHMLNMYCQKLPSDKCAPSRPPALCLHLRCGPAPWACS